MKGPLTTLAICLIIVMGTLGYGLWERHIGAQAVEARVRAESLLVAAQAEQRRIALSDSIRSKVAQDSLQRLNVEIRTTKHLVSQAQARGDSIAQAISGDSVVPRDSVQALIGAFQAERAASAQTVSQLEAENALLTRTLAGKDSTIAALNHSLDGERQQLATALRPHSPGILSRGFDLATKTLALYGLGKLVFH